MTRAAAVRARRPSARGDHPRRFTGRGPEPLRDQMTGGTYTLLVEQREPATLAVGALGEYDLPAGRYAYTGSALGPGGFARVERHREVAGGERAVRHWHVDHLLGHPAADIVDVVRSPGRAVECAVARDVGRSLADAREAGGSDTVEATPVPGFGASDCDCDAHLAYAADGDVLARVVRAAHRRV